MKAFLAVVSVALLFVQIHAAEEDSKQSDTDAEGIKVYKRLIPADVLRGMQHMNWIFFLIAFVFGWLWSEVKRKKFVNCFEVMLY